MYTYMHLHMDVDADAFLSCSSVTHRWPMPRAKAITRWSRCSCSTAPSEGACLGARLPPSLAQIAAGCLVTCHVRRRIHAESSPSALASDKGDFIELSFKGSKYGLAFSVEPRTKGQQRSMLRYQRQSTLVLHVI